MLKSMTGYGSGECVFEEGRVAVEVKSVNHRYLDISCRVPRRFSHLENEVRKAISKRFSRGRFDVGVQSDFTREENQRFELNLPLAEEYCSVLKELKERLHLRDDISLSLLASVRDIILVKEVESKQDEKEKAFNTAFNVALDSLEEMRKCEGKTLCKDFSEKLDGIKRLIDDIIVRAPQVLLAYRDRLAKRVKELTGAFAVDAQRLDQEIAFLAERSDITEELARITSHLEQFGSMMNTNGAVGRKLDFLLQEINREVNTIASKASDAEISQKVVEIKSELEKIREQVQNIE
ncbi:MAG: YicC/YloC family endoribonuclease [Pseudomonadota bacterium]